MRVIPSVIYLSLWLSVSMIVSAFVAHKTSFIFQFRPLYSPIDNTQSIHQQSKLRNTHREIEETSPLRPTQTWAEPILPEAAPERPKIVVFGATGRVGRTVVRQLLDMPNLDATVVAFVRDYDKACRVLYDDFLVAKSQSKGPKLQIVLGDLVPPEDLPGKNTYKYEEELDWERRATSAATFYDVSRDEFDNREYLFDNDDDEALEEAIKGCSCIINCVGDVRPTNVWTDILARPLWRLLRRDVSTWCNDGRHPYYVHFRATRKILRFAELEQKRREAKSSDDIEGECNVPRIRLVRISDVSVAAPPWQLVPIVVNILQSMVFRYHSMAENVLAASPWIDTVTLRAGDLVEDERNETSTSLQVLHTGRVASPAIVGKDDVAALAVASGLFPTKREKEPFHYCLACRWASEDISPYPAQGKKSDGFSSAHLSIQSAVRKLRKRKKFQCQKELKPYGLCVAIPLYFGVAMVVASVWLRLAYYFGASSANPALRGFAEHIAVFAAYLSALSKPVIQGFLKWLTWRPQNGHYFSF